MRYNSQIMRFLQKQVQKVHHIANSHGKMPLHAVLVVRPWLTACERMVLRHTQPFDLERFYGVDEAQKMVKLFCQILQESLRWSGTHINCNIPDDDIINDREYLERHLGFVVGDKDCAPDSRFREEWNRLKERLSQGLEKLKVINENEIELGSVKNRVGSGGTCVVYEGVWGDEKVAVKKLKDKSFDGGKFQCLAQFYMEALINVFISDHDNVVKVFAMSQSGMLLMELANEDLLTWCQHTEPVTWTFKIQMMHQAAKGLHHLHKNGVIHRDVKSANFLVFDCGPHKCPIIKLCDFGIAIRQRAEWIAQTTKRSQPRTELYAAPEIRGGKPHSGKSDVFSFGLVMCEIAAQMTLRTLYHPTDDVSPLNAEQYQRLPHIPFDCPRVLKTLIIECLSAHPRDRPSMRQVEERLEALLQLLRGDLQPWEWQKFVTWVNRRHD